MGNKREKVVVAMSGGVDSSVAACLLVEQGYDVMGFFMRVGVEGPVPDEGTVPARLDDGDGHVGPNSEPRAQATGVAGGPSKASGSVNALTGEPPVAPGEGEPAAREHQGCCSASDAADARFVAGMLGIPFYALNFQRDFDRIIEYFADEYVRGRTPNPCIVCNDRLKFGKLVGYADAVGAKYVATGHYARIGERDGWKTLLRGRDERKDQSYVLFGLERALLDRVMFPVGELAKSRVREIATRYGLPNRDKPDSVEICFVPDRDYARVVRERRPQAFVEGDVLDQSGKVMGRHKGIGRYTVGQRRGLGIAAGKPIYVTQLDVGNNTVTVGDGDALLASVLIADRAKFLVDVPERRFRAVVKIRYLHKAVPATVEVFDEGRVRVAFDEPQRAITPGQAVVFYEGDIVLGGAWIEAAELTAIVAIADCGSPIADLRTT